MSILGQPALLSNTTGACPRWIDGAPFGREGGRGGNGPGRNEKLGAFQPPFQQNGLSMCSLPVLDFGLPTTVFRAMLYFLFF